MIKRFKAMHNIMKFYVMFAIGLIFQSIESIVSLADFGPLISVILSGCALVCFLASVFFVFRKDKKKWSS